MRNNKAPGKDGIQVQSIKYGSTKLKKEIFKLVMEIWEKEEMLQEWRTAVIFPIHKKDNKAVCSNYRGISLLNMTHKVFSKILAQKLEVYTEKQLGGYQYWFRRDRSKTDQIFSLRMIFENCYGFNINLH